MSDLGPLPSVAKAPRSFLPDATTWLVGLGNTLALAGQSATFWMVGALTGPHGLSIVEGSRVAAVELVTMGVMMGLLSPLVHRLPRKRTIVCAVSLILVTQALCIAFPTFWPLLLLRAVAGMGFGTLFAVSSAIGASSRMPERTFALAGSISLVIGTTLNPLLGYGSLFGPAGVFAALLALCIGMAIPLLIVLFRYGDAVSIRAVAPDGDRVAPLSSLGVWAIIALMAGATNGVFVFTAKIAATVGIGGPSMGAAMAGVSLFSASGGLLASKLGTRFGTLVPLCAGLVAIGVALCWMSYVGSPTAFWISFTAVVTVYWFNFPYILGLASMIDPKGRVASAASTAKIFSAGAGTAVAGEIAGRFGFAAFGGVAFAGCLLAALLVPLVLRSMGPSNTGALHG